MAILLIVIVILVFIYLSFNLYLNHIIDTYIQNTKTKHLSPIGVDENVFIGLHKKSLEFADAYMLYARKTTAYKGVILFSPDWQLTYRFYMPLLNFLCRQGYIIVTYQKQHTFYSESVKDLENLYEFVKKDEVLGTYPISCLGHGTGGLIQLCANIETAFSKVAFQPSAPEIKELMKLSKKQHSAIERQLVHLIQKKYGCDIDIQPKMTCSTYMIYGDEDSLDTYTMQEASIKVLNGQGHYPFLNMDSEQHIKSLECLLCFPQTPQFEYNKAIETFDTSVLFDLNQEVLDILPYLFEYENTEK